MGPYGAILGVFSLALVFPFRALYGHCGGFCGALIAGNLDEFLHTFNCLLLAFGVEFLKSGV